MTRKLATVLTSILVISLLGGLLGCGGTATGTPSPDATPAPTKAPVVTATPSPAATPATTSSPVLTPSPTPTPTMVGALPPIKQQTLKLTHGFPLDSGRDKIANKFKELVEKYTNQQIKVDIYPNGTLFSRNQSYQAVSTGSADISTDSGLYVVGVAPWYYLLYVAGLFTSVEQADRVFQSDLWKSKSSNALAKVGIQYLGDVHTSMQAVYLNNKVKAVDLPDLKGLKMGLPSGVQSQAINLYAELIQISTPTAEIPTAFQTGMIDVQGTNLSSAVVAGVWDTAKYMLVYPLGPVGTTVLMNKTKFDGLPKEYQGLLLNKVMPELYDFARAMMIQQENDLIEVAKEHFDFVSVVTPAQIAAAWDVMKNYDTNKKILSNAGEDMVKLVESMQ